MEGNNMDELISKRAVIEAIEKARANVGHNLERSIGKSIIEILDDVGRNVDRLPSALGTNLAEDGTDLISRAAAQTELQLSARRYTVAHEAHGEGRVVWSEDLISVSDAMDVLRKIPSAQPTFDARDTQYNLPIGTDLISRQAAIDAINCDITITGRQNAELVAATIGAFVDRIKALPSAQPEIIRCKDCKYWDTTWQNDYAPNYHYCPMIDGTHRNDFYCADAERREETT